ncbi:MAG TPA: alcohol dehydrogenase catalytic domain-containing protein [Spirochaetia bacterium]|nr:alcohol dehydrogenase catalytic domain-containing protein [Spirochaetia bacterium]
MKSQSMRAARLFGKEDLRIEDMPVPEIGAGEILLRVKSAAICGTDIRMYRNGYRGVSPETPLVLGHEVSGVVERVGAGVSGYAEGMRVAVAPNMGCGVCDMCVSGNTQLCPTYKAFGINLPGGFAQFMKIPEAAVRQGNLAEIPAGADFTDAALVEPLSCVYNAFKRAAISPGDTVLVIGAGPIGLMHAKLALMGGAARVYMNDISPERLALCTKAEPSIVAVPEGPLAERMKELTAGRGVDVCITAAPVPEIQVTALEVAAVNGRVVFFGGLPEAKSKVPLDTNLIHYRQLVVTGTARSSLTQYRQTLALVASGAVVVRDLVTAVSPVDGIKASFEQVMQGKGLKNVIQFP